MKRIISILALTVCLAMLLSACGNVSLEDLRTPTFEDDQEMVIGAWSGSMANWNEQHFSYLQDAEINLLLGTSEYIAYTEQLFDMAEAAGVRVIPDSRKWDGDVPSFVDHPAFVGYCVWDEPNSGDFEKLAEKKAKWDSVMADKMFFVNVFPGWAGTALGGSFDSYISNYMQIVQPEVLCFDHYPLMKDAYENTVVRDTFFSDMDICSHYAKQSGVDFWFTLLAAGHLDYVNPTEEEFRWQMAVGQAYGARGLVHYVYTSHDSDYTCPIDWRSQAPTELYENMAAANSEVAAWDHIYMNYDWQGTANIAGSNNPYTSICFQLCQYAVDPEDGTGISSISSDEDLLCGIFEDEDGNEAYMLTNATNPAEKKDATVKLKLDKEYKGVLVIDRGAQTTKLLDKQEITIEVESSEGVFVIPLTKK